MVDRRTMRTPPKVTAALRPGFAKLEPIVAAVDSAKHKPAWAVAEGGELRACGFDEAPGTQALFGYANRGLVDLCVLEASRSYGSQKDAGKHGDILAEAIGGALTAGSMRASKVALCTPDEWAGQTKKPPRHLQVWKALTVQEKIVVAAAGGFRNFGALTLHIEAACDAIAEGRAPKYTDPVHNLLDAVGLLLFAVGRIGRGGARIEAQRERPRRG